MIKPELIKWARERANISLEEASKISKKYQEWEEGESQPTSKQEKKISQKFHVPFGYLYLSKPPEETIPIPDFRTIENKELSRPSPELLESIYDAQRKQNWLREAKIQDEEEKLILKKERTEEDIIKEIKDLLEIENIRRKEKTYEDFLKSLIEKLDDQEFLIIRNGVVGNNTHRPLKKEEFKGFALFDEYAPLIFINGKDYKSSQIFTLVHELVHLFSDESALDGEYHSLTEQRCNKIAAEILLPEKELRQMFENLGVENIARKFKVSVFVALIKAKQCNLINEKTFQQKWNAFEKEMRKRTENSTGGGGGDFYKNVKFRAGGKSFMLRVYHSVLSGKILYRDAYDLTKLRGKSFDKYFRELGF